jgi:hypothetical protein
MEEWGHHLLVPQHLGCETALLKLQLLQLQEEEE